MQCQAGDGRGLKFSSFKKGRKYGARNVNPTGSELSGNEVRDKYVSTSAFYVVTGGAM